MVTPRIEIAINYYNAMKKRHYQIALILLLFAISWSNLYGQILLREASLEKQINNSSFVIEGKVLSKKSFWDEENKNIYTANVIEVYKVFKGQSVETIEIITEGGTVGLSAEIVTPSLKLNVDDIGVFMLYENNINLKSKTANKKFKTYGSLQGFYKYNLDTDEAINPFNKKRGISSKFYNEILNITKTDFVEISSFDVQSIFTKSLLNKAVLAPTAITFSPTTITAGTKSILTITIPGGATGNFGGTKGKVSFSDADLGGNGNYIDALDTQVVWSSNSITVEVPSEAGTGKIRVTNSDNSSRVSSTDLTVTFSELNVVADNLNPGTDVAYRTRHVQTDASRTFLMYTSFNNNTNAKNAFLRAMDTWRCETGINWVIDGNTTTKNVAARDDENVVRFDMGADLDADVLGRTTSYYTGCSAGSTLNWYVSEIDLVFNDSVDDPDTTGVESWYFGSGLSAINQFDFQSVALHELGHGHQLGHVVSLVNNGDNLDDVMHYNLSISESQKVLFSSNITAAMAIQARSTAGGVCGQLAMSNHPCSLSIDEEELKEAISIYPNPAKGLFNIKNSSLLSLDKVVIYDIRGRLISEYNMRNSARIKTINLYGASKGMYFVNIHSEKAMITKKLVLD